MRFPTQEISQATTGSASPPPPERQRKGETEEPPRPIPIATHPECQSDTTQPQQSRQRWHSPPTAKTGTAALATSLHPAPVSSPSAARRLTGESTDCANLRGPAKRRS